jgi:hypothetical protein
MTKRQNEMACLSSSDAAGGSPDNSHILLQLNMWPDELNILDTLITLHLKG